MVFFRLSSWSPHLLDMLISELRTLNVTSLVIQHPSIASMMLPASSENHAKGQSGNPPFSLNILVL